MLIYLCSLLEGVLIYHNPQPINDIFLSSPKFFRAYLDKIDQWIEAPLDTTLGSPFLWWFGLLDNESL